MAELAVRREMELQEKRDEGFNVKKGAQEEAKEKRHAQEKRAMIEAQLQQANVQLAVRRHGEGFTTKRLHDD